MLSLGLLGCNKTPPADGLTVEVSTVSFTVSNVLQAKVGDYIYDGLGKKYKKITNEELLLSGISKSEIWERVEPLENTKWYMPSLTSKIYTNEPPTFNSLYRMEGEEIPYFNQQ